MSGDHTSPLEIELGTELAKLARSSAALIERAGKHRDTLISIGEVATEGLGAPTHVAAATALRVILRKVNEALKVT